MKACTMPVATHGWLDGSKHVAGQFGTRLLLIDEHCGGGIIMEVDRHKLASAVLLRKDDGMTGDRGGSGSSMTQAVGPTAMPGGGMNDRWPCLAPSSAGSKT